MADCQELPVYRYDDRQTKSQVWLSCWRLTWKERLSVLLTGKAWLWVHQFTHPPVAMQGENPFGGWYGNRVWMLDWISGIIINAIQKLPWKSKIHQSNQNH